jgi:hypothetical protein
MEILHHNIKIANVTVQIAYVTVQIAYVTVQIAYVTVLKYENSLCDSDSTNTVCDSIKISK